MAPTPLVPNDDQIKGARNAVKYLIEDGCAPLCFMDCFWALFDDDRIDEECMHSLRSFCAIADDGLVQWVHPDILSELNAIDAQWLQGVIKEAWSDLPKEQMEQKIEAALSEFQASLAGLNARARRLNSLVTDILAIGERGTAADAHGRLLTLSGQYRQTYNLVMEFAAIIGGIELKDMWQPGSAYNRAIILSRYVARPSSPRLLKPEHIRACARLEQEQSDLGLDVLHQVAEIIAQSHLDIDRNGPFREINKHPEAFLMRLETCYYERAFYPDRSKIVEKIAIDALEHLSKDNHVALKVLTAANSYLAKYHHDITLTAELCEAYRDNQEIPF